jgi:ABC-type transport system involved in multi-copper enzyme maturation permease subunit
MIRLLKIEFKKVANNKAFWILIGLYALILGTILFGVQTVINEFMVDAGKKAPIPVSKITLYDFPGIWQNLTYLAGYLKMILAIVVIIFITNEYSYRTIRQNIITGLSRWDFLLSKLLMIAVISIGATLFLFIIGLILGFTNTPEVKFSMMFENMVFVFTYLLELFAFMTFALMLGILAKRSGITIGLLLLYFYVIERYINYKLPNDLGDFLPIQSIGRLIDIPNTDIMKMFSVNFRAFVSFQDVIIVVLYTALFVFLMHLFLKKRDL